MEVKLPAPLGNYDRQTNQPNGRTRGEVKIPTSNKWDPVSPYALFWTEFSFTKYLIDSSGRYMYSWKRCLKKQAW